MILRALCPRFAFLDEDLVVAYLKRGWVFNLYASLDVASVNPRADAAFKVLDLKVVLPE